MGKYLHIFTVMYLFLNVFRKKKNKHIILGIIAKDTWWRSFVYFNSKWKNTYMDTEKANNC